MQVVITHELKVLYLHDGKVVQRPVCHVDDFGKVVCVKRMGVGWTLSVAADDLHWFDFDALRMDRAVPNGMLELICGGEGDMFGLRYRDKFMRANQLGSIDFAADNQNLWESFRLIDMATLRRLHFVLSNRWIVNGESDLVEYDATRSGFSTVSFGKFEISFVQLVQDMGTAERAKKFIFFDGWKANEATLFNPVLVFVLFGHGVSLRQFEACMESINRLANYPGDIIVIGNVDAEYIRKMVGPVLASRTRVIWSAGEDQLDYVGARISIFNTTVLDEYQPILYSDVDIVFDTDINEFLVASALADKCSAQVEPFHNITSSEHTGATLVRQDEFAGMDQPGFNGGLLMIPNIDDHGVYLRAAFRSMIMYTTENGRNSIPFYDQSVLNYTLYKMRDFSASPVSERTQIGGPDFAIDPSAPRGFVHFWNAHYKPGAMRGYVDDVVAARQKVAGSV